jgi:predicted DNA-binding protein YlxM (UPF0122 family)
MAKLSNLTKNDLSDLYINKKNSLEEIALIYNVSKVAVYKKLQQYGIKTRSKSEARIEAQKQNKVSQQFFDINEGFFDTWSPEMAYILGLIITDGCISKSGTVSLCINDLELLEKTRKAMNSAHKITPSRSQKGLFCFHFSREKMTKRLKSLGVIPNKSLVVKFPEAPKDYLADLIRGIFDGDGSVFFDKRRPYFPLRTKFVSGSEAFIQSLKNNLGSLGMPKRKIYKQKTKNGWSYIIVYDHKDSVKLFKIIYNTGQNQLFPERKYNRFLEGLGALKHEERTARMA